MIWGVIRNLALTSLLTTTLLAGPALAQTPAVVGGPTANIEDWPFLVSVQVNKVHRCGGSLIGSRIVLTAAKCLQATGPDPISVVVGRQVLTSGKGQRIAARQFASNPGFNQATMNNDLAVILLAEKANAKPIRLATREDEPPAGSKLLAAGWGAATPNGFFSADLRQVMLPLNSENDCGDAYFNEDEQPYRPVSMLCAGNLDKGGSDVCRGDGGGPLITAFGTTEPVLLGTVSWGSGCGRLGKPGVYMRISHYRPWIEIIKKRFEDLDPADEKSPHSLEKRLKNRRSYLAPAGVCLGENLWSQDYILMQKRALRCLIGYARRRQGQSQLRLVGLVDSAAANLATNLSGVGKGCLVLSSDPFAELTAKPCGRSPEWPLEHVLSEGERSCSVIATYYGAGRVVGSGAVTPRQIMITILKNRRLSRQMLKSRSHSVIGIGLVTRFSGKQQTRYWAIYTAKGCAGATISDLGGLPELWSRS